MMKKLIHDLDDTLELIDSNIKDKAIILSIQSANKKPACPYCNCASARVHSYYIREIQDLPIMDKQTILLVKCRKMFCNNPDCEHKTFSEELSFAVRNAKKTKRLYDKILKTSSELSSVGASKLLKQGGIKIGKSMICGMLKKNASDCG